MMATSVIGTLPEFNPEEQDTASYLEKVELFFEANSIAEEKKVAVFLTAAGQKTYEILRHHSAPKLPREKSFEEILTLFKQHFHYLPAHHGHQPKADYSAQVPENQTDANKSTDSVQSQPSGRMRLKNIVGKIMNKNKGKEYGSRNSKDACDKWELSLTDQEEELKALQELGLGVAVDITTKHPWVTKSAFQAKLVNRKELVVINESNRSHRSREQVETYTSIQQSLESSFRPDPTTPINVTVAADFHRSSSRSKTINSQMILTRTVAFRAKDPSVYDSIGKEEFESNLHNWLVEKKCYPVACDVHKDSLNCGLYSETTNHHCIDYLKELGGVTHYVSSITLGATKYQVALNSTLFASLSSSSEVSAHTFTSASTKSKVSKKVFQSQAKEQHIGKIPEGNSDILQFRTKGEAVIKCSYNSQANLVSHPQLRIFLERGINEYIDLKKNGTRGPYHICTAEFFPSEGSETEQKTRLYWKINWKSSSSANQYSIVSTRVRMSASNFYLKPIVHSADDSYFWIVTDPEDHADRVRHNSQENEEQDKSQIPQQKLYSNKCKPQSSGNHEPQRYVRVDDGNLVVELNINPRSAKKSAFKLKNPRDDQTYPLHKSQWLPEALRGSQPYIIGREGKPFRTGLKKNQVCSVYMQEEKGKEILCGKHRESADRHGFFILESGHKT